MNITFHSAIYGNELYSMNYSLDGKANQTVQLGYFYFGFDQQSKNYISATVPILNLSDGTHNLTVYLQDTMAINANNVTTYKSYYDSQTVVFTIAANPSNPSNSPTPSVPESPVLTILPLLLSVFSVAVIIRYRKKQVKKH